MSKAASTCRVFRGRCIVLAVATLAFGAPGFVFGGPLDWFRKAPSCSDDPDHDANSYIDFTAWRRARDIFRDPRSAALAGAAARNAPEEVRLLLKQGADPNARGEGGITMLSWTLRRNSHEAFGALLDAGADASVAELSPSVQPRMDDSRTILHEAAMIEDPAYLEMLLAHHVSPDLQVAGGRPALDEAMYAGCDRYFHRLIAAHANVNLADTMGNTPLHHAALINQFDRIIDLVNAGANPTTKNRIGATFQTYLRLTPNTGLTKHAQEARAQIDAWLTAHHVPIEGGEPRVAQPP